MGRGIGLTFTLPLLEIHTIGATALVLARHGVRPSTPGRMTATFTNADAEAWSSLIEVDRLTVVDVVDNASDGLSTPCLSCDASQPGWTGAVAYRSEFSSLTQACTRTCSDLAMCMHGVSLAPCMAGCHPTQAVQELDLQAFLDGTLEDVNFRRAVHGGHGLSLLLIVEHDGVSRTLLLDGGPEAALWAGNAERLGLKGEELEAAVLSHWHPDHSVGLSAVAQWASSARRLQQGGGGGAARSEGGAEGSAGGASASSSPSAPMVFDLHPDRPLRRGFQMQDGTNVPFNEVGLQQ